jgi:imidazolonepropionase-like amidohydrolase
MELKAIVEEATAANIHVMAHAYTPRAILNSVKAGIRSIEHGNLLNKEAAEAMAENGTFLVPTLVTYDALTKEGKNEGLTQDMVSKVHDVLDAGKRSIGIAHNAGVTMCYGSDLLSDMRKYQLTVLALMEEAGLSPIDGLRCATTNAALLLGMESQIGTIEEGKCADIVIIKENPLLSTIVFDQWEENYVAVLKQGKLHSRRRRQH